MTETIERGASDQEEQAPQSPPTAPQPTSTASTGAAPAFTAGPRENALLRFAISITVLNIAGHLVLGFEQSPITPITCVLVAYVVAIAFEALDAKLLGFTPKYRGGARHMFYFLLPAHISALAVAMLVYADNWAPYVFATVVAVCSKYVFRLRVNGRLRHYLNPSNFGIALTFVLFTNAGFAPPYQFITNTSGVIDWAVPMLILSLGTMLNGKLTKRMPLILGWVGGYVLQAFLRWAFLGDSFVATIGMMTGVAFVLYTNYMITDPATTPSSIREQVIFGLSTALVYGLMIAAGVAFAIFFALVLVCLANGLRLFIRERRLVSKGQ